MGLEPTTFRATVAFCESQKGPKPREFPTVYYDSARLQGFSWAITDLRYFSEIPQKISSMRGNFRALNRAQKLPD